MNNFLAQMKNDPRAKELLKALPAPKSEEEALAGYQSVAKQLGFDLSQNEIQAALKAMAQEQKEKTDKVAMEDADLESVAGGGQDERCSSTFDRGEWCWFSDSCSYVISYYDDIPDSTLPRDTNATVDLQAGEEFLMDDEDDSLA